MKYRGKKISTLINSLNETKKTNVILTSYPYDRLTPSTLKLGAWSEEKKQEFLEDFFWD